MAPMDLLNLTRTTKAFRRLLMSRSNVTMWKKALEQDPDLPACPSDLNEVEYTRLVYDNHCYVSIASTFLLPFLTPRR